jgi:hypothetical protein
LAIRVLDQSVVVNILWIECGLERKATPPTVESDSCPANLECVERESPTTRGDGPIRVTAPVELDICARVHLEHACLLHGLRRGLLSHSGTIHHQQREEQ